MYTIHAPLSKVPRSWNIPGNRKQKKIMKMVKRHLTAVSQHRSSAASSETELKSPAWSEPTPQLSLGRGLTRSVSAPVPCIHCAWANPSGPRGPGAALLLRTQPLPCLRAPAVPEPPLSPWSVGRYGRVLPPPAGNPRVLWATLLTPVTWLRPGGIHRAKC